MGRIYWHTCLEDNIFHGGKICPTMAKAIKTFAKERFRYSKTDGGGERGVVSHKEDSKKKTRCCLQEQQLKLRRNLHMKLTG